MNETKQKLLTRLAVAVLSAVTWHAAAFALPRPARAADSASFANNRDKLERMSRQQRLHAWQRRADFLALPAEEQQRIRRLHTDLQALPPAKRERYKSIMDGYRKWRDALPLYQRQALDDAAADGSSTLYNAFRDAKAAEELDDRERRYWLVPDRPALRGLMPNLLAKLTPEQMEQLDQTSPLDRGERLLEFAQQLGFELPAPIMNPRLRGRGPLPPVAPEKLFEFRKQLSKQQIEVLNDPAMNRFIRQLRMLEWYYEKHPEELPESFRRGEPPMGPRNPGDRPPMRKDAVPADGRSGPPIDRKNQPRPERGSHETAWREAKTLAEYAAVVWRKTTMAWPYTTTPGT